jgi:signal transduction histidine kinase
MNYKLQFGTEEVVAKFSKIVQLDDNSKKNALIVIRHELLSDISGAFANASCFTSERNIQGTIPTIQQRAYVDNILNFGRLVYFNVNTLRDVCMDGQSDNFERKITTSAKRLVNRVEELGKYLPSKGHVQDLGPIEGDRLKFLGGVDVSYRHVFYTFNLIFADNFERDIYNINEDIQAYWTSQFYEEKIPGSPRLDKPSVAQVNSPVNYFANVLLPLIKNVHHHAFNPENDLEKKLQNPKFHQGISITSDRPTSEKGEITFRVLDNGFGIRPELHEQIFDLGVSSKPGEDSGVGLWAVKKFVEDNGGKIYCETRIGRSTSFNFTVPYSEKKGNLYIQ